MAWDISLYAWVQRATQTNLVSFSWQIFAQMLHIILCSTSPPKACHCLAQISAVERFLNFTRNSTDMTLLLHSRDQEGEKVKHEENFENYIMYIYIYNQHIHSLMRGHFSWSMFGGNLVRVPKALIMHF